MRFGVPKCQRAMYLKTLSIYARNVTQYNLRRKLPFCCVYKISKFLLSDLQKFIHMEVCNIQRATKTT